ncbi:hypothetical protein KQI36_15880 [Clostridium senegalense]|uniref:hypothetical protein n=1 Tax=Clostridium senegalense TaxID=1465809 RepID=UPI001C0F79E3|nr:hypothetical protein [Clostridium senegalense]MBU5228112.1 hypothetical protein [Clostridium senegalense]
MINFEKFNEELKNIDNDSVKEKLIMLYNQTQEQSNDSCYSILDDILGKLFNPYGLIENEQITIPISFYKTEIGKIILNSMSYSQNEYYTVTEFIDLTKTKEKPDGYSKQYIIQEIKAGRLKGNKDSSRWIIYKSDAVEYLKSKGIEI